MRSSASARHGRRPGPRDCHRSRPRSRDSGHRLRQHDDQGHPDRGVDGVYRQTYRGEAPTTVEAPFADVTVGVVNAITEVQELAGRRFIDDDGRIIRPATADEGCDIYISTSSAGGGLQMMVAGVVREMTAESAKRAALGAGAIVMDVLAVQRQAAAARADSTDSGAAPRHDPDLRRHRRRHDDRTSCRWPS